MLLVVAFLFVAPAETKRNVAPSTPVDADLANNEVAEGASAGSPVGVTAFSTGTGTITYSLTNDASSRFTIDSTSGVVTVTAGGATTIDFESSGGSYLITVQATDSSDSSMSTQDFTINVNNVAPSQPTDSDAAANSVQEGAANGSTVGVTASSTDPNGGTLTYSLTDDASGRFTINSSTGVVTVANGAAIDYETAPGHAYTITAKANDGTADSSTQDFTINVTDVNDNPTLTTNGGLTVVRGHSGTIDNTKLLVSDADNTAAQLTFTIGTATTHGTLKKSSTSLAASDTFTQDDINNNLITYQQNSADGASADSFTFTVSDGAGGSIGLTTFNITINCFTNPVVTSNADSGAGTLRDAIIGACTSTTITFDMNQVTSPITLTTAELLIDKDLTINGPTSSGLTISGNSARRVFNIQSGKTVLISNLTIANGLASQGGGILNAGTLTITNSTLNDNKTTDGADVNSASAAGNSDNGGAIYSTGTLTLINSTLSGNQTGRGGNNSGAGNGGNSGSGGGVYNTGTMKLTNSTVANNKTGSPGQPTPNPPDPENPTGTIGTVGLGGGIFTSGGTLTLNNTIVATNVDGFSNPNDINGAVDASSRSNLIGAGDGMTGISDGSNGNQVGTAAIPLSPHLGALADNGGPTQTQLPDQFSTALDAGDNSKALDQNNVALTTDQRGAGFPRIVNSTVDIGAVESNQAPPAPGADLTVTKSVDRDTVVPDRDLTYTIVVSNNGADAASNVTLDDTLPQYTTNSDPENPTFASTTFGSITAPGWTCSPSSTSVNCSRASFAGTSTQTLTLVVHVPSNAVPNSGAPFITNSVTVNCTDDTNSENNSAFVNTQLFGCLTDPIVTTNANSGPGSLRQAIADACVDSTITFDMTPGHVTSPITLTSGELLINKNLTITGPGANLLTISGNNASRVFNISSGTVKISGLTISGGKKVGGSAFGGGVLNSGTLTLINTTVSANNNDFHGGGISNNGTLTLTSSTVSGNNVTGPASNGGGIYIGNGTVNLVNSTVSGNTASLGGGIFTAGNTVNITNCTISGNNAANSGGGIRNNGGVLTLANTTVANNRSDSDNSGAEQGGGISRGAGTVTLKNTIGAGNFRGTGTTRDDISGAVDATSSFNLIGDGTNLIGISNGSSGNQVGSAGSPINAMLGALASNGGGTQTHLLLPGSPAINAGSNANLPADTVDLDGDSDTAETLPVDQRGAGFNRVVNTTVDIGAVETNYVVSATAGTPQSATINSAFATAMKATVTESGNPQNAVSVTFTAPASGASGAFPGPSATAVASTNSSGVATAPTFTANGIGGSYNVVASIGTSLPTALFALTNNKASTATAVSSSPNPSNSNQSVTFTATVTSAAGTPTGTVQFKDGGASIGSPQTLNGSGVATFSTSSLSAGVHTITAEYSGDAGFLTSTGTLAGGQQVGSIVRFSASNYNTTEGSGFTTITVQRIGDLSQAVTVDYTTPDDSSAMTVLPCSTANGVASSRCDFEVSLGTLRWAAGDGASKTFTVLINQDNFVEGPETLTLTLSNLTGGAGFPVPGATTSTATLTIADDVSEPATNPIDDTDTFVRQLYRDFLNRDPDAPGLAFWKDNIDKCNDPARRPAGMTLVQCLEVQRINTAASFFLSIEFQNTGFFVERTYKAGFGDISPPTVPVPVRFTNFLSDTQQISAGVIVGQGSWQAQLENNKTAFALAFVQRPAFLTRYPAPTSATALVDSWNTNAGSVLSDSERSALISELSPSPADPNLRASVLKKIAENATLQQREFNRAFVLLQYFGFLRRNPDAAPEPGLNFAGYNFWLNKLNQFNGNYIDAEMVKAFLSSFEYRKRFGP
jgi:hypothetical protein